MWDRYENMPKFESLSRKKSKSKLENHKYIKETISCDSSINIGDLHNISNKALMIPVERGYRHPGAVLGVGSSHHKAKVSKGTDARNVRDWRYYIEISPDDKNGLKKATAFNKTPKEIGVVALQKNNIIGYLNKYDFKTLLESCGYPSHLITVTC